ncbi:MAG TPA: DUF6785 family protein [Capsulimonadaceae bacterium]|nr:DUF6785 family protein [Capsulimonadaceae bacterium]
MSTPLREAEQDIERQKQATEQKRGPRWLLALLISLPLIVLNAVWIANSEMRTGITEVTISTLFSGVLFVLFILTLLNLLARRLFGPSRCLSQSELLIVYMLLSLSSSISGVGSMGFFTAILVTPFYYATPQNGWKNFWDDLPWYIGPRDKAIYNGYFNGYDSFFHVKYIVAWAGPLLVWSVFFLVLLFTMLCLAAILRRRWAEEEHLPFPVIALPLELTRTAEPGNKFFKSPLLWAGFAIPSFLHTLNTIASIKPGIPTLQPNTLHDLVPTFQLPFPWNGLDSFFYLAHGSGVGFGYLINLDVSFSLWIFYLLKKALDVWGVTMGWRNPGQGWFGDNAAQFPFTGFQGIGAWLALGVAILWRGRFSMRDFFRRAWNGDPEGIDSGELFSARTAVVGFALGFLAMCAFVWSMGGSLWLPVVFLAVYVLIMMAVARIRAETAVPCTELIWINPQNILTELCGTEGFSKLDLTHMGILSWFNTDYRAAAFPHLLEGQVALKRAQTRRIRPLFAVLSVAAVVALIAALLASLQMYYVNGAATAKVNNWRVTGKGEEPWNDVAGWLQNPRPVELSTVMAALVGVVVTLVLSALRARFADFPLHPAGYVLNTSFANDFFWMDMFIAWLLKAVILRYGGMALYRRLLPFFLGLILGDFVTGAFWSIIGTVYHLDLYRTFAI